MNNNAQNITPGQRLRIFRESLKDEKGKKFTQQMFGEGIGYSRNWIGKWEQDLEEIPESAHEPLKRVYGLNPEWLETGEGPQKIHELTGSTQVKIGGQIKEGGLVAVPPNNHEKIKHLRSQVADTIKKTNSHPGIRVWAYAGAGNPFNADPAESEPMEVLHIESLVSPRYRDAFRITGISMAPVIRDRALVFCDFNDKILKTGGIYALNIPGEGLVVKEIRSEKEEGSPMRWVVYSYNEALYKPLYYALNELEEGNSIVGRIVLIHQELPKEGVHINLG